MGILSRREFLGYTAAAAAVAALPATPAPTSEFGFSATHYKGLKVDRIVWTVPHSNGGQDAYATVYFKGPGRLEGSLSTSDGDLIDSLEEHRRKNHSLTLALTPQHHTYFYEGDDDHVEESGY